MRPFLNALLYLPTREPAAEPADFDLEATQLAIETEDDERLDGWWNTRLHPLERPRPLLPRKRRQHRRSARHRPAARRGRLRPPPLRLPRLRAQQRTPERGGHLPRRSRREERPARAGGRRSLARSLSRRVARRGSRPRPRARGPPARSHPAVSVHERPQHRRRALPVELRRPGRP